MPESLYVPTGVPIVFTDPSNLATQVVALDPPPDLVFFNGVQPALVPLTAGGLPVIADFISTVVNINGKPLVLAGSPLHLGTYVGVAPAGVGILIS